MTIEIEVIAKGNQALRLSVGERTIWGGGAAFPQNHPPFTFYLAAKRCMRNAELAIITRKHYATEFRILVRPWCYLPRCVFPTSGVRQLPAQYALHKQREPGNNTAEATLMCLQFSIHCSVVELVFRLDGALCGRLKP